MNMLHAVETYNSLINDKLWSFNVECVCSRGWQLD